MRLRQVVTVATDLRATDQLLRSLFGLGKGYSDPGVGHFGLDNVVLPIGDTFLEVVSPKQEGTTAGRFLERRGGDGGYMVIIQVDDMESARRRVRELGHRIVWQADHDDIKGTHLHPRDIGGAILSLDEAIPAESWRWAGPDWESEVDRTVVEEVVGVELEAQDPLAMAERWAGVLERPVENDGSVARIRLDRGELRFVAAGDRGEGVAGFDLAANDAQRVWGRAQELGLARQNDRVEAAGVFFRLV